jgi:hypothetical protein
MMTLGQINLWRYCVKEAGREALKARRPVSTYHHSRIVLANEARIQVARATHCAKWDDVPYSRWESPSAKCG